MLAVGSQVIVVFGYMVIGRRQFAKTAALGLAGLAVSRARSEESSTEVIDIHQHLNYLGRTNDELIAHQAQMGVTCSVLLPPAVALREIFSRLGDSSDGSAARGSVTEASAQLTAQHPNKFVYFCNDVPSAEGAVQNMETWLKKDAVGIGEMKYNLECDSEPMVRVYELASEYQVPVMLHFEHGNFNLGFDRFHKILERFPKVNFIGHAQTWWGNIDAEHKQEVMYPKGTVTPGGMTDRYLADYPNMYGDLSAGSGKNALDRDPEHAVAFLKRHQDKLCLGTDCSDVVGRGEACSGAGQIANIKRFAPDPKIQAKLFFQNARRIIKFP